MSKNNALIAAIAILLAGTVARCRGLDARTLSFDESFSWRLITAFSPYGTIQQTAKDVHPPLYYLVLRAWIWGFGDSPSSLRAPSLLCGASSLVLVYALARDALRSAGGDPGGHSSRAAGIVAMALVASSGAHIRWSGEARMYSLSCMLALLATWLLIRGVVDPPKSRRPGAGLWVGYCLAVSALLYTHYYMIFLVAAHGLWLLAVALGPTGADPGGGRTRRRAGAGIACLAIAGVLFLPWLPVLLRQVQQVRSGYWIARTQPSDMAKCWTNLLAPRNSLNWGDNQMAAALVGLSLVVPAWLAYSGRRAESLLAAMIAIPTLVPVAMTAYGMPIVDEQTSRYWLTAYVFFALSIGVLICRHLDGAERWLFAAVLVANNVFWSVEFSRQLHLDLMTGAKGAVAYIQRQRQPGEPIVVRDPLLYLGVAYYLREDRAALDSLRLLLRVPLVHYNGGPVITERDLCEPEDLERWGRDGVWVADGALLTMLLTEARLPDPWRPQEGTTKIFPEPYHLNGKVAVSKNRL